MILLEYPLTFISEETISSSI